jgi:hypothetical protein
MGDTLLPDADDEMNHRLFPFSSPSPFFMNFSGIMREITRSLMIVLHVILENFTGISPQKKYPAAFIVNAHPKCGLVLS